MPDPVIVDAVRTPVGTYAGSLSRVRPDDLAATVLRALVSRTGINAGEIEEVFMGCANQAGEDNRNVARMALLLAGFPARVAGLTVNRLCSSGLDAIIQAHRSIAVGDTSVCIAGGVESMSRAPFVYAKSETPFDRRAEAYDTTIGWRFPNPRMKEMFPLESMGETAENIFKQTRSPGNGRMRSPSKASVAPWPRSTRADSPDEIIPVEVPGRGGVSVVQTDEHPRMKLVDGTYELATSAEQLAKLKPAFRDGGSVTAGNSSGLNDGAAAALLCSREAAVRLGLGPLARIISSASAGVDPRLMGLGPVPATRKALEKAGLSVSDLDLIELNEAFAVQALAVMDELRLPHDRTNVNGGAIALGHPLGCSGARLVATLLHEMKRRRADGRATSPYGLVTLCVGVGQGVAAVIELV